MSRVEIPRQIIPEKKKGRLTEKDVRYIRKCNLTSIELGEIYDMHPSTIQDIRHGIQYKWVEL